ncbi:MAG: deoxyribose-phosphate aldolase, partial [Acidimicrobiaceae bacterium]
MTPFELAKFIDHTLLAPEATTQDIVKLCEEANAMKVAAVCFSPSLLPIKSGLLSGEIALACVTGFPSGAHTAATKAFEAANAVEHGASEIDMVVNLGFVFDSMWLELGDEISKVRKSISESVKLKVIIESAALTDEQIVMSCRVAVAN